MDTLEFGIITALLAMLVMAVALFYAARRRQPRRGDVDGGAGGATLVDHARSDDGADGAGGAGVWR